MAGLQVGLLESSMQVEIVDRRSAAGCGLLGTVGEQKKTRGRWDEGGVLSVFVCVALKDGAARYSGKKKKRTNG